MYSNIVVGTDGSPTAKTALQHAIDLAAAGGAILNSELFIQKRN